MIYFIKLFMQSHQWFK